MRSSHWAGSSNGDSHGTDRKRNNDQSTGVRKVSAAAIVSLVAAEVALMSQQVEDDDTTS